MFVRIYYPSQHPIHETLDHHLWPLWSDDDYLVGAWCLQGVVLDGWLFPMKDETVKPEQPILFINTESFMSRHNIERMKQFLTDSSRKMIFIKGSVHQNHIDAPLIFKDGIIKKIIGMQSDTDPILVLDLNDKLMLDFMITYVKNIYNSDNHGEIFQESWSVSF